MRSTLPSAVRVGQVFGDERPRSGSAARAAVRAAEALHRLPCELRKRCTRRVRRVCFVGGPSTKLLRALLDTCALRCGAGERIALVPSRREL